MSEPTAPEEWRPIAGYEGFYEVSSRGRVRSLDRTFTRSDGRRQGRRGRILSPTPSGRGYPSVQLRYGVRRAVHVLVCTAFHGLRPGDEYEVAHENGVPTDNRVENLRWATRSENQSDSVRHGTKFSHAQGEMAAEGNYNARVGWEQVLEIRARWDRGGVTQLALAEQHGLSKSQVHNIVHRKQWLAPEELQR